MDPSPTAARREARRSIPRAEFRGVPVFDCTWSTRVLQDCESADPYTPRLWAPRARGGE